jgi:hypothetical protein
MRTLLSSDPFLPPEARAAVADSRHDARDQLLALGVNECEAAELLDALDGDCHPHRTHPPVRAGSHALSP